MDENTIPTDAPTEPKIVESADLLAGVPDGHILESTSGKEVVVYDRNENGDVVGWHKEVA